jgi:hypothetical protein
MFHARTSTTLTRTVSGGIAALLVAASLTVLAAASSQQPTADAAQNPTSCPSSLSLVNGSFEQPNIAATYAQNNVQIDASNVPGWDTTATDNKIELWNSNFGDPATSNSRTTTADDGSQFAELNATQASTLYQAVNTTAFEGQTLQWHVSHRGRLSATTPDAMQVLIGPSLGSATAQTPTGASTANISDTDAAWGQYTGSYTVPAGQATTVFAFQAVSSANGDNTVGNFLDNISFGTAPCLIDTKTVTDTSRVSGIAQVGDTLQYVINTTNNGGVASEQTVTTDALPAGVTYVPGTLTVSNSGITSTPSDQSGDDAAEYNSGSRTVTVRLGAGATSSTGGAIPPGATSTVTFNAVISSASTTPLVNTATTQYVNALTSGTSTATSNPTSTPVQNVVTAVTDTAATSIGTPVDTTVLTNDTSADGSTLSVTAITQPANGTVTRSGNVVTYTPHAGYTGSDVYHYTVCDSSSPQVCDTTGTVNVTVGNSVQANIDTVSTTVATPVATNVVSNDTSGNGSVLSVTSTTSPTHGTLSRSGNVITYTPDAGYTGADTYHYTVCDSSSPAVCNTSGTVNITVTNIVDAANDTATTTVGTPVSTNVVSNDTSANASALTVTTVSQPAHGSVSRSGNVLTYTPSGAYTGTDSYTYTVCDTSSPAVCDTATVNVTINNVIQPNPADPSGIATPQNTSLGSPVTDLVTTTGAPLDPTTVTLVSGQGPSHGSVTISPAGVITYTPTPGYSGPDSYQINVCDTSSPAQCGNVTIPVTVGPDVVTAVPDSKTVKPGTTTPVDVLVNDWSTAGTPLDPDSVAIATLPQHGTVTVVTAANATAQYPAGTVLYTPNPGYLGTDSFRYSVCDTSNPTPVCGFSLATLAIPVPADTGTKLAFTGSEGVGATGLVGILMFLIGFILVMWRRRSALLKD